MLHNAGVGTKPARLPARSRSESAPGGHRAIIEAIFDSGLAREAKYMALALIDFGDDEGGSIPVVVRTLAHKTGYTLQYTQKVIAGLKASGVLEPDGRHPQFGFQQWRINVERLPKRAGWAQAGGAR